MNGLLGIASCAISRTSHPSHRSFPRKVTCIKDGFFFTLSRIGRGRMFRRGRTHEQPVAQSDPLAPSHADQVAYSGHSWQCNRVLLSPMRSLDRTSVGKKYRGKWVALAKDRKTVVASSSSAKGALTAAARRGHSTPVITRVPESPMPFVGRFDA